MSDQKALTLEQIRYLPRKQFLYQWTAVDVNSRFKLMAYSDQKSEFNGLTFFLWVLSLAQKSRCLGAHRLYCGSG